MTDIFSTSSRLAHFRERKPEDFLNSQPELKLTLPQEQKIYEPSSGLNSTKTSIRLFRGRLERAHPTGHQDASEKQGFKSSATVDTEGKTQNRISWHDKEDMKLVLNDSPNLNQKKISNENVAKPAKRIMIIKEVPKEMPKQQPRPVMKQPQKQVVQEQPQKPNHYTNPHDQKPIIKEEQIEESKEVGNENDLVICPQGCGRKFNRKALEKHAKACKLVFMSKRKQFNSEAKRISSKEQANIIKQNKLKQKSQLLKTKSKGFEKTSDNWKAASEDLRAVIKAAKRDDDKNQAETQEYRQESQNQRTLNLVSCQYCQKMFANALIQTHSQNCIKKKEKQRELQKKKSGIARRK